MDMPSSKNKQCVLDHCWKSLKNSKKWKLKEQQQKMVQITKIENDEDDDASQGGSNKNKPGDNMKAKEKLKKQTESSSLREKIDHMVQSNMMTVTKTPEAKMLLAEKKAQEKQERWQLFWEEGTCKAAIEEITAKCGGDQVCGQAPYQREQNNNDEPI